MPTKTDEKPAPETEETKVDSPKYTKEEIEAHRKKLIKKIRFMHLSC